MLGGCAGRGVPVASAKAKQDVTAREPRLLGDEAQPAPARSPAQECRGGEGGDARPQPQPVGPGPAARAVPAEVPQEARVGEPGPERGAHVAGEVVAHPVVDDGVRRPAQAVAGELHPERELDVVAATGVRLVPPTHRVEHGATDPTARAGRVREEPQRDLQPVAPSWHPPARRDRFVVRELVHEATDEIARPKRGDHRPKPSRSDPVVGVAEQDELASRGASAAVAGVRHADDPTRVHDAQGRYAGFEWLDRGGEVVGRSVVGDDQLPRAIEVLGRERGELVSDRRRAVAHRDHDAHIGGIRHRSRGTPRYRRRVGADVLVIALDAADADLIERWVGAGELPTFARLGADGAIARLSNSLETLPGAIWPELATGVSGGRLGLFYHPSQIHTGEAVARPVTDADVDASQYYWAAASDAGRRVAVVDIPQVVAPTELNGLQVFEWGLHDRNFEISSRPPGLIDELRARYGDHPVDSCDAFHEETAEGYRALRVALLEGVERKTEMLVDLVSRDEWDLFTCAFGEAHCVGHQFWHFMDASHPEHDPTAPIELRDAILDVYRALDRGVGAVIDAAGPRASVLVVASHGMGMKVGGPQLLPEVLVRLGLGSDAGVRMRVRTAIPEPVRRALGKVLSRRMRGAAGVGVGAASRTLSSPGVRAIAVRNNRCGGIRLNLVGREPNGTVQPGVECDALVDLLRRELLALRDPVSREPIVTSVVTAEEAFGRDHHPDVPDVMVVFRSDLGPLEACESASVGRVAEPVRIKALPRTGDHIPDSQLWALGPTIARGRLLDGDVLDVAPTVLELLGVPQRSDVDGRSLAGQLVAT
jgi:predicted AlkP superfamily phosphohydrolase/phosphomutase